MFLQFSEATSFALIPPFTDGVVLYGGPEVHKRVFRNPVLSF